MVVQLCNEWTMVLICSLPVNPTMHAHAGPAVWEWWGILIKIQCACNYVYTTKYGCSVIYGHQYDWPLMLYVSQWSHDPAATGLTSDVVVPMEVLCYYDHTAEMWITCRKEEAYTV